LALNLTDQPFARIGVALAVFVGGLVLGRVLRAVLRPRLTARRTPSFGDVFSRLIAWAIYVVAGMAALTIVFPSVRPVDFIAGLGIFTIAIGFAFQDILSNLLAGLLLIVRQPFERGDQIEVNELVGTVEGISIRETSLKTFDGIRVIVPNADVYKSAIKIRTAFEHRRTDVVIGVGYDDDLDDAEAAILDACRSVDGVAADPAPEAYLTELGDNAVVFDLRYWTEPHQPTVRRVQHEVLKAVKQRLDAEDIDMPFPTRTIDAAPSLVEALRPDPRTGTPGDDTTSNHPC
jgi:small-conductance mechanosensitive channel